jgi:hypothetical protein
VHGGCIHDAEASSPLPPYLCTHVVAGLTVGTRPKRDSCSMPGVTVIVARPYAAYAYEEVKYHDITE